jgi:serine/threonine protein kinase
VVAVKMSYKYTCEKERWWLRHLNQFKHRNIISLIDHDSKAYSNSRIWLVMMSPVANCGAFSEFIRSFSKLNPGELYDGHPSKRIREGVTKDTPEVSLPEEILWTAMKQLLSAINFLHTGQMSHNETAPADWLPIVHGDVKPGNILVHYNHGCKTTDEQYTFIVSDFGHADFEKDLKKNSRHPGTPWYMAPEFSLPRGWLQKKVKQSNAMAGIYDRRADVWGVGVSIHQAASFTNCRWTYTDILTPEKDVNGQDIPVNVFHKVVPHPVLVSPVHLKLNHPHRSIINEGYVSAAIATRNMRLRQYSRMFSYHLYQLLGYVGTRTEVERASAAQALESIDVSIAEIRATRLGRKHTESEFTLSNFEKRALRCTFRDNGLNKLYQFHRQLSLRQFLEAFSIAQNQGSNQCALHIHDILTHWNDEVVEEAHSDEGSEESAHTPKTSPQLAHALLNLRLEQNKNTASMWADKDMIRPLPYLPTTTPGLTTDPAPAPTTIPAAVPKLPRARASVP